MILAIFLIIDILLVIGLAFTPYITRKTELFGVTIPAEKTAEPELVKLRASYRSQLLVTGAVLVAVNIILWFVGDAQSVWTLMFYLAAIFIYLAAGFGFYLSKHNRMKELKRQQGWDKLAAPALIIADTTPSTKDVVSPLWLLLLPLIIGLIVLAIIAIWPQVPQQVPMHFNASGTVDSYATKGFDAVLPLLITQVLIAVTIALCYLMIRHSKRQIDAANPEVSVKQSVRFRRATSIFLIAISVAVQLMLGIMQIMMLLGVQNFLLIMAPVLLLMVVTLVGLCIMMFKVGQGGSRIKEPKTQSTSNTNVDDDRYWKLGQFYFNPNDPALFVEKRFGVGYTTNFSRPLIWLIIAGFIVLIAALSALIIWISG